MPPNEACICREELVMITDGVCGKCKKFKSDDDLNKLESKSFCLPNPHLMEMKSDNLHHLAISTESHDLVKVFGDVKFVCMGGTASRMLEFAQMLKQDLEPVLGDLGPLEDLSAKSGRYSMFKHGIGVPSLSVVLAEVLKLLHHAEAKNPIFLRIGTCGGIGLKSGTLVITKKAVDGMFRDYLELPILGKLHKFPAIFDQGLLHELEAEVHPHEDWDTVHGTTVCAPDFYEGQGRVDGAFCSYSEEDKLAYMRLLASKGVTNIEMETVGFGALTYRAGVRAAAVCVTLLDRLQGDQLTESHEKLHEFTMRPLILASRFIKRRVITNH